MDRRVAYSIANMDALARGIRAEIVELNARAALWERHAAWASEQRGWWAVETSVSPFESAILNRVVGPLEGFS